MYSEDGGQNFVMRWDFLDGSVRVQELTQYDLSSTRYDVDGSTTIGEYYTVHGDVLGMYDDLGLIRNLRQ